MAYIGNSPVQDETVSSAQIIDGAIVNADINSSAAIALSKTALVAGTGLTLATNTLNVDAAQTGITSVGTIATGVWNGTAVASAYLDADTAHLSTVQTFSGAKTFSANVLVSGSGTKLYFSDAGGEHIAGDGTDLTITSGADIILAGTAVNITADTIDLSDATKDVTLNAAVDALNFDSNTLSIDASNNRVGIGTASPATALHLSGAVGATSIIKMSVSDGTAWELGERATAGHFTFRELDGNKDVLTMKSTGYVGIGTAVPQSLFQVANATGTTSHFGGIATTDTHFAGISLGYTEAGNANYRKTAIVQEQYGDGNARGHLHFLVDTNADGNSFVLGDSKFKIDGTTGICNAKNGITFGSDSAAANTIDDYEEGTFEPVLSDGTNNAVMHSVANGFYTKIGDMVHINMYVLTTSLDSVSGGIRVTGLPFTSLNSDGNINPLAVGTATGFTVTAGHSMGAYISTNEAFIRLRIWNATNGQSDMVHSEWTDDGEATIGGTYKVAT